MDEQQPIKVMYFGPRPAGRSPAQFRERWREHGQLAMGLAMWDHHIHYEQFDVLAPGEEGLTEALAAISRHDTVGGVGMIWMRNTDALAKVTSDSEGVARMVADEIVTFGAPLGSLLVPTSEHVVYERAEGPIALIGKLHRRPTVTRDEFSRRWKELGAQFAASPALTRDPCRYCQNHALADAEGCDGYVQLEFQSAAALESFLAEPLLGEWLQPTEGEFIQSERIEVVIARRHLMYDEASGFSAPRGG